MLKRLQGEPPKSKPKKRRSRADQGQLKMAISAGGVKDVLFRLSRCCAPLPGDPIVGFITRGRGVTVHRADCPNLAHYSRREAERIMPLEWTLSKEAYFPVVIQVDSLDRVGLLSDITGIISSAHTNIIEARVRTGGKPKMARFTLTLEVQDLEHLKVVMGRVSALSDVLRVDRARHA